MKTNTPSFKWKTVPVLVSKIKPTPGNFKLKTEEGLSRFNTSIKDYGLAGAVVLNADYTLIDGNTRWEKAKELGEKYIDASMPNKLLTPKQFKEFSALFDFARAGEVDLLRIKEELGTTNSFFKKWGIEIPKVALNKLAELEAKDSKVANPTGSRKIPEAAKEVANKPITIIPTVEEHKEFMQIADFLYPKLKVDNVTDLVMKLMRAAKKQYK